MCVPLLAGQMSQSRPADSLWDHPPQRCHTQKKTPASMLRFLTSKSYFAIKQQQVCLDPTQQHPTPKYQEKLSSCF